MQIHEIAKAVNKTSAEVLEAFGVEGGQGAHLRQVDDEKARAYIVANGGSITEPESTDEEQDKHEDEAAIEQAQDVRFWTTRQNYTILEDGEGKHGDIIFRGGVFSGSPDDKSVKYLLSIRNYLIAQGVYRVFDHPHDDPNMVAEFITAIIGTIHTGPQNDNTPSREMRDCIQRMLPKGALSGLSTTERNHARSLARLVAKTVSLDVDEYQEKL